MTGSMGWMVNSNSARYKQGDGALRLRELSLASARTALCARHLFSAHAIPSSPELPAEKRLENTSNRLAIDQSCVGDLVACSIPSSKTKNYFKKINRYNLQTKKLLCSFQQ